MSIQFDLSGGSYIVRWWHPDLGHRLSRLQVEYVSIYHQGVSAHTWVTWDPRLRNATMQFLLLWQVIAESRALSSITQRSVLVMILVFCAKGIDLETRQWKWICKRMLIFSALTANKFQKKTRVILKRYVMLALRRNTITFRTFKLSDWIKIRN
jgi:hypothetical protein